MSRLLRREGVNVRLLVSGWRWFDDVPLMWSIMDSLDVTDRITCVIDGKQQYTDKRGRIVGADYWANQWAICHNRPEFRLAADWDGLGKAAGPVRNTKMLVDGEPDFLLAFLHTASKGTRDMIQQAQKAGLNHKIVHI